MDHTAHLASEDTLQNVLCRPIKESQSKAHKFVEKMKESSLMKEAFLQTMVEAGEEPLAIIKGTSNRWDIVKFRREKYPVIFCIAKMCFRWYYWYMEVYRMLVLRPHVERFQAEYEGLDEALILEPQDWHNLEVGL